MKLEAGKLYKDRCGRKWHVDYANEHVACGHCDGGGVETWFGNGSRGGGIGKSDTDLVAPWTEPKLRPWKPEDVPDCWIRKAQDDMPLRMRIQAICTTHVLFVDGIGTKKERSYEYLLSSYEHSTDGGKTWNPCGVIE